ncbi:MAG TPA: hypothetical protein VGV88_03085 [Candidatus Dormibacteraeota bacterium]|nr:hypothetical protein [Candidatus Dormibacteraeota bacterium]
MAAWPDHPRYFGQRLALIGDVLEHVKHRGHVNALVRKWQVLSRSLDHDIKPPLAAVADRFVIDVDAVRAAESRKIRDHGSRSAADVQQSQRRSVGRLRQIVRQEPEDDLPPA